MPDLTREVWRDLGQQGALRDLFDTNGRPDLGRTRALLAQVDGRCPLGVTLSVCVQVSSVLPAVVPEKADAVRKAAEAALRGEVVIGLAATDEGAPGSDLSSLTTSISFDGDAVEVTGGKRWIVNAVGADHFLVLGRHREGHHFTDFTTVLVPADAPGVRARPAGTRLFDGSGVGHVEFDRVRVDRGHLVGRPGQGMRCFVRGMVGERVAGGAWAAALLRRVLNDVQRDLLTSRRGAVPLWESEVVRHRFARCVLVQRRLDALWRNDSSAAHALVVKAAAAEAVDEVLGACASFGGADAFDEGGLHELRAASSMWGVAGGTTDTMLASIADHARELLEPLP
ncbi:acyl-CoA dehydrogenase family protein [Lentzea sp. NPDC005914]|uniref:acyl-CoA dehydrogenase family protein n=1 Tax=Lentzea sp. NPDC005914 TaxID=3154572 RepID=UPI0033E7C213